MHAVGRQQTARSRGPSAAAGRRQAEGGGAGRVETAVAVRGDSGGCCSTARRRPWLTAAALGRGWRAERSKAGLDTSKRRCLCGDNARGQGGLWACALSCARARVCLWRACGRACEARNFFGVGVLAWRGGGLCVGVLGVLAWRDGGGVCVGVLRVRGTSWCGARGVGVVGGGTVDGREQACRRLQCRQRASCFL